MHPNIRNPFPLFLRSKKDTLRMKEEKLVGWLHSNKYHTGGSRVLASLGMIGLLLLSCLWFLLMPYQSDVLFSSIDTVDHSSIYDTVDEIQADPVHCDLSRGEWVPDPSPPLYNNDTCRFISTFRNCLQNGRPDRGYLHWKWKPSDCELPRFNASHFLELLRWKKIAFIGDSLARDHGQSLLCTLTQVEDPQEHEGHIWFFPSYNFTLAILWSPFLVQNHFEPDDLFKVHLDVPEGVWTSQLQEYDVAIISAGYWYFRRSLYFSNNTILGTSAESGLNFTTIDFLSAFRMAWGTLLKYMATEYQGIAILRTVTVDHFEHGVWNAGGKCNRTQPFFPSPNTTVPWIINEMSKVQTGEFEKAMALVNGSANLKILNVTYSAYLRPDGHPGLYRNRQEDEPPNDCLHWCLPGPVDMWNQLVLHTLEPIFSR